MITLKYKNLISIWTLTWGKNMHFKMVWGWWHPVITDDICNTNDKTFSSSSIHQPVSSSYFPSSSVLIGWPVFYCWPLRGFWIHCLAQGHFNVKMLRKQGLFHIHFHYTNSPSRLVSQSFAYWPTCLTFNPLPPGQCFAKTEQPGRRQVASLYILQQCKWNNKALVSLRQ